MKHPRILLALALGLGLQFASCSDNDINSNGASDPDTNTEQTDQEWQKQIALQRLLGAFASIDSLPDNWNSTDYHVSEPTIGQAASDATPYSVRLVPTTSVEEAYREYCSYIGKASGDDPTTDTWQTDGIGTLTFTPNNQSDLYATLKVSIQQLPTLQEIRFVPASVLGDNTADQTYYHNFGDVIEVDGCNWVCVRPANAKNKLGETHWCTFQLKDDNFKAVEKTLTLPTGLGKIEDKNQRMVQNFFNLLLCINDPKTYEEATGIDKIDKTIFTQDDVKKLHDLWQSNHIWDKIIPTYYVNHHGADATQTFLERIVGDDKKANVLYYGYTGKYNLFKPNTYKVYDLELTHAKNQKLFSASPKMVDVEWGTEENKDLSNIVYQPSYLNGELLGEDYSYSNLFIVKYRTGAQLQGRWLKDANDNKPTESLQNTAKGVTSVFIYNESKSDGISLGKPGFTPYFTFGDMVRAGTDFEDKELHTCIIPANNKYGTKTEEVNDYAYFISNISQPKSTNHYGEKVTDQEALCIAFQLLRVYAWYDLNQYYIYPCSDFDVDNLKEFDQNALNNTSSTYYDNKAIYNYQKTGSGKELCYSLSVNFYTGNSIVDKTTKKLTRATTYTVKYYPELNEKYYYTKKTAAANDEHCAHFVPVFKYNDNNSQYQTYGEGCYSTEQEIRDFYKDNCKKIFNLNFHKDND